MNKHKKIFWLRGTSISKFHAFTLDSGVSLCGEWFIGARAPAEDWDKSYDEGVKCQKCKEIIAKEMEKVIFT